MIYIIKNKGQISELKGKYIFYTYDEEIGDLYAKIGIKPVIGCLLWKIKKLFMKKGA